MRVLLVDDDTVANMVHRRAIKKTGLAEHIDAVDDGAAALDYLKSMHEADRPDVILLDINMPGMNGFEFLEVYATLPEHQQARGVVIMLTTSLMAAERAQAEANPFVHAFLDKPLASERFSEIARQLSV
ncbi:MAG: response regulator [Bradymonadia bacterium]